MAIISTISFALSLINAQTEVFAQVRKIPVYKVDTQKSCISLTFDAAWGSDKTQGILDLLDKYQIKCTFFLVSFWIKANPELVKEIDKRGHEIGTHSATHPDMTKLSKEKMLEELTDSCNRITELTGKKVRLFRPPFGAYNNTLISVAESLNLITIQWDCDSLDWKGSSALEIATRAQRASKGSIILCHNNSDNIIKAIPLIVEVARNKGLKIIPVGELIYQHYYVDSQGVQHEKPNY
ncbi:MAG: polysaccharide deacetylase family protein [Clostridia bacterium]